MIFDAVAVMRRGQLSKGHVYAPDNVPLPIKIAQEELIEVLLLERASTLVSEFDENKEIRNVQCKV